jgi:chromosome segregation ATPase
MFKALFSSIERIAIVVLLAALAYATYQLVTIENDLTEANKTIKSKSLEIDNLAIQTEFLAQSVELTEKQNQKLIRERESLSRINQAYQDEVSQLTNSLNTSQSEIDKLRESSDEATKQWANDSVPCDAIRLLKYARTSECDKDGGTDEIRVRNTAGRISIQL